MSMWILLLGLATVFIGVVGAIVAAEGVGRDRSQIAASLATIEALSGPVPSQMRSAYDKPFDVRVTQPTLAWFTNIARTISGSNWTKNATHRLDKAGNPSGWNADRVLAWKALTALALASVLGAVQLLGGKPMQAVILGAVGAAAGFFLPDLLLLNKAQKRAATIQKALPDSIDLLTISVESGLAFDAALAQVAQNTDGPLAEEFARVLKEVQIGRSRSEALHALAERTTVDDLRIFLNSMVQAEKLGVPIADVLRVQSSEMRVKRSQRIEEQAMKLPVKIIFPLLLGIMPALFIVIIGPAAISISENMI